MEKNLNPKNQSCESRPQKTFSDEELSSLRATVKSLISPKRFRHTCEVENTVVRICELYIPEKTASLRAAAILHDITKEYSFENQLNFCKKFGIIVSKLDMLTPKTLHARTASELIKAEYPKFADEVVVSAVRWHTTGRAGMTLEEKILYLADYIDDSRTFEDCVWLRNAFWDPKPQNMTYDERINHLNRILIISFDMTIRGLLDSKSPIGPDIIEARNALLEEMLQI